MPITGPSSYVPTTQAFLAHWADVNTALTAPTVMTLAGALLGKLTPVVVADLQALYDALLAQRTTVTDALVDVDFARSDLGALKARLASRMAEFTAVIRGNLPSSKYARALPAQAPADAGQGVLAEAVGRVKKVWNALNDGTPFGMVTPVVLQGGYGLNGFETDVTALPGTFMAVTEAGGQVKLEQEERNDLQDRIYPLLKAYRQVMPTMFAPGNALTDSLPDLTPAPGSTPAPVALTAALDGPTQQAHLTWTASGNAELDHYEVRAVPGGTYNVNDEVQVATVAKEAARTLLTDHFLTDPGQTASFKVYVVLTTENEAGSNARTVARPA